MLPTDPQQRSGTGFWPAELRHCPKSLVRSDCGSGAPGELLPGDLRGCCPRGPSQPRPRPPLPDASSPIPALRPNRSVVAARRKRLRADGFLPCPGASSSTASPGSLSISSLTSQLKSALNICADSSLPRFKVINSCSTHRRMCIKRHSPER